MDIPIDKICPVCEKYRKRRGSWTVGPYGEAICNSCHRRLHSEDIVEAPLDAVKPELCPVCERSPNSWVKSGEGFMCRSCFIDPKRLVVGSVRVDKKGRYFRVAEDCIADYGFGERRIPLWSEVAFEHEILGQQTKMWIKVEENLGIARKAAADCAALGWFPYEEMDEAVADYAQKALSAAAVMFNPSRHVEFSTYAYRACRNALIRYSKSRREKDGTLYEEVDSSRSLDAHERAEHIHEAAVLLESLQHLLSDVDREVLQLKFVDGLTYAEVGIRMGVRAQAIFLRVQRIRKRVAEDAESDE